MTRRRPGGYRGLLEAIVADMLADGELKAEWLCPAPDDD
jgi:hypothetical protein